MGDDRRHERATVNWDSVGGVRWVLYYHALCKHDVDKCIVPSDRLLVLLVLLVLFILQDGGEQRAGVRD